MFLEFQPSKLVIFAACFGLGIYAYSKNWFTNCKQICKLRLWGPATILLSAAFLVIGQDVFQNPLTATALSPAYLLLYAAVRSFLLLFVMITVCSLGVRYFSRPSHAISSIADNSYYIYLLHLFFVSTFQDILMIWQGPIEIQNCNGLWNFGTYQLHHKPMDIQENQPLERTNCPCHHLLCAARGSHPSLRGND